MDPYYISVSSEGEACFIISINRRKYCQTGWWVIPTFTIELPKRMQVFYTKLKLIFE